MKSLCDASAVLADPLAERVLVRLGFHQRPALDLGGLSAVYDAWCRWVPFDNVRKLIHVRSGSTGPLPGHTAEDFFEAWLRTGAGGTCWAGSNALHALLAWMGFPAERGLGTMLVAPELPPNHGTVRVVLDGTSYLLDSSILHGAPLRLDPMAETEVCHRAWGVRCRRWDGHWRVQWRPLHQVGGLECRLETFGVSHGEYGTRHEQTRGWSPFNFELSARLNREDRVVGLGFGESVSLEADGSVRHAPVTHSDRVRILQEELGFSEELVARLPLDLPTPPPPGSRSAALRLPVDS